VWYVLSAKYNVLDPDGSPIEALRRDAEQRWRRRATRVEPSRRRTATERDLLAEGNTLVIHAGKAYYEEFLPLLHEVPVDVEIPTEGLRMGETLSWYNERNQVLRRRLARSSVVKLGTLDPGGDHLSTFSTDEGLYRSPPRPPRSGVYRRDWAQPPWSSPCARPRGVRRGNALSRSTVTGKYVPPCE